MNSAHLPYHPTCRQDNLFKYFHTIAGLSPATITTMKNTASNSKIILIIVSIDIRPLDSTYWLTHYMISKRLIIWDYSIYWLSFHLFEAFKIKCVYTWAIYLSVISMPCWPYSHKPNIKISSRPNHSASKADER